MKGVVKFKLGGLERRVTVPLGLALAIEEATGVGILRLASQFINREGRLTHALAIVRLALAENGIAFTAEQMLEDLEHEGIPDLMVAATKIVSALFDRPKGGAPGKAPAGEQAPATTSH